MENEQLLGLLNEGDWKSGRAINVVKFNPLTEWDIDKIDFGQVNHTVMELRERFDTLESIMRERARYMRKFNREPSYLSLNKVGYESLYVRARSEGEAHFGLLHGCMGMKPILNPHQDKLIMVLGTPDQELFEGSLYDGE